MAKPSVADERVEAIAALKAILDGYRGEVIEVVGETAEDTGTAFIRVENPDYEPDNGKSPFLIIDVRKLVAALWPAPAEDEVEAAAKLEKIAPVQGYSAGIPWSMHLRAYDAYCKKWGAQPAMIDLEGRHCRGGFSVRELDGFIPGWREELSELHQLRAELSSRQPEPAHDASIAAAAVQRCAEFVRHHHDGEDWRRKSLADAMLSAILTSEPSNG